jgi:hypothetical protein
MDPIKERDAMYRKFIWVSLILGIVLSFVVIGSKDWYLNRLKAQNLISTAQAYQNELKEKTSFIKECNVELSKLRERMEGIKNNDDLLKRDIFLYIDKKFQIIPRTVALDIAEQILILSKQYEVSPELVVGIIQVESGFNPMAISKANARGLMQVMPEWAPKFGLKKVSDLHDIDTGIESGIKVLKIHIEEDAKGNISKGLYYYVGKDKTYAGKVFECMGKFVAFRSTVDDDDVDIDLNGDRPMSEKNDKVKEEKPKTSEPTTK